jgi:hypothetical protein
MVGLDGKVCTKIERKKKLLAPKLDTVWKHGGRKEVFIALLICRVGKFYMNKKLCLHAKNK